MRDILTGLAILLIIALAAALAGPYFIDWNAHRAWFEDRIRQTVGLPVAIEGPIEVRLLPSPVMRVDKLRIGEHGRGPALFAEKVAFEVATAPLLRGEIRVVEASLEEPSLTLTLQADGTVAGLRSLPGRVTLPPVALEKLRIRGGSLIVSDKISGRTGALFGVDADADAESLAGPWRIAGQAMVGAVPLALRLATSSPDEAGAVRVRLTAEANGGQPRVELDGRVELPAQSSPRFDGRVLASGRLRWPDKDGYGQRPWSAAAQLKTSGRIGRLDQVELEAGGDEASVKLTGTGNLQMDVAPRAGLVLEAKQVDLDRPLFVPDRDPLPPARVLSAWLGALTASPMAAVKLPLELSLSTPAVLLGGDALSNVALDLALDPSGTVRISRAEGVLPGATTVQASGDAAIGPPSSFSGRIGVAANDAPRLAGWLTGERSGRSALFGDAKELSVQGDLSATPEVVAARSLRIALDRSAVQGTIRYTPPDGSARGRFEAQLVSDGLALEQLPDLQSLTPGASGNDLAITLDARNVRVGRTGGPNVGAGRVALKVSTSADALVLDTLDIADIGGASLKANGRLGADGGRVEARVDARQVQPLADILRRFVPGPVPGLLGSRAADLSPLKLRIVADRGAQGGTRLAVDGTAATTRVSGTLQTADWETVSASSTLEAPEAATLLTQFGLDTVPLKGLGRGRLDVRLDGRLGEGARVSYSAEAAGSALRGEGHVASRSGPDFEGTASFDSANVTPLLQILGLPALDLVGRTGVSLKSKLSLLDGRAKVADLSGSFGQQALSGQAELDMVRQRLALALSMDRFALSSLTALAWGAPTPSAPGLLWSSARFPSVPAAPLDVDLELAAKSLDTGLSLAASGARLSARWQENRLEVSAIDAALAGGRLGGAFTIRRYGGLAALSGRLSLKGAAMSQLLPSTGIAGSVDLDLDGGASAETPTGLVAGLAGGGQVRLADAQLPRLSPAALPGITATLDAQRDPPDPKAVRDGLSAALDRGPFTAARLEAPVTVSQGVMRIGPITTGAQGVSGQGSISFDLKTFRSEAKASLTARDPPPGWGGPPPQANLEWRSTPAGGVTRDIDVSALTNVLTTRAVARELERMEAVEADLRERNFFARRLKSERDRWERAQREAEEARLAEEARIKAEEEARQKAEQERRAAEDAARRAEEQRRVEDAMRRADEARQRAEAARRAAEEESRRKAEEGRRTSDQTSGDPQPEAASTSAVTSTVSPAPPSAPRDPSVVFPALPLPPLPPPVEVPKAPQAPRQPSAP